MVNISAVNSLKYISCFPQNVSLHFMQIVSPGDKLHEMSALFSKETFCMKCL